MDDVWETGLAAVLHVLLNNLGVVATAARTLTERWTDLSAEQRAALLCMIDESTRHGVGQLDALAATYA